MEQLDLFAWANTRPTAQLLDWYEPFARRVMARIHEYDDDWPKPHYAESVVAFPERKEGAA